jgi:hypothetical protein
VAEHAEAVGRCGWELAVGVRRLSPARPAKPATQGMLSHPPMLSCTRAPPGGRWLAPLASSPIAGSSPTQCPRGNAVVGGQGRCLSHLLSYTEACSCWVDCPRQPSPKWRPSERRGYGKQVVTSRSQVWAREECATLSSWAVHGSTGMWARATSHSCLAPSRSTAWQRPHPRSTFSARRLPASHHSKPR